jgi:MFS family permease
LLTLGNKKSKIYYGYVIVASTFVIMVAMIGTVFTFGVFFTPMLTEFGWGRAVLSGAFSMSFLLSGFLGILAGRLSDRFGPRSVVLVCSLFFGLGFVLMSQVHAIWQLYLFRGVIIAIGLSAPVAPLQSTVVRWFVKRRGLMVAIFLMGPGVGSMIMPPIANWLILLHGWRTAYIVLGAASFLVIFLAALFLKRDPAQMDQLPYGADEVEEHGVEPQYVNGLSLQEAFHTVQFWLLCAFFFCIAFVMMTIVTHIVPHAIDVGISSTTAAIILAIVGGVSTVAMIPEGSMADRIGVKRTAIFLTALLAVSMLWLLVTGQGMWSLFLFAVVFGLAFSSLDILLTLLSSSLFGLISLGAIIGFVNSILQVGSAIGPFAAGLIFDSTGNYHVAFLSCAAVTVIALIISLLLRPIGQADYDLAQWSLKM